MKGITRVYFNRIAAVCCLAAVPALSRYDAPAQAAQPAHSARVEKPAKAWLGFGIACGDCELTTRSGMSTWSFRRPPVVAEVTAGSPAARAGLRAGDTLIALDGVSLVAEAGGERLSRMEPGQKLTLAYRRGYAGTATLVSTKKPESDAPDEAGPLTFSGTVGGTEIEVRGGTTEVTADKAAGTLEIRGRDITVRVRSKW